MGCGVSTTSPRQEGKENDAVRRGPRGEIIPRFVGGTVATVPVQAVRGRAPTSSPATGGGGGGGFTSVVPLGSAGNKEDFEALAAEAEEAEEEMVSIPIDNNLGDLDDDAAQRELYSVASMRSHQNGHKAREPGYDVVRVRCDMAQKRNDEEKQERRITKSQKKVQHEGDDAPNPLVASGATVVKASPTTPEVQSPVLNPSRAGSMSGSLRSIVTITSGEGAVTVRSLNHWGPDGNYALARRSGTAGVPSCAPHVESWLSELPNGARGPTGIGLSGEGEYEDPGFAASSFRMWKASRATPSTQQDLVPHTSESGSKGSPSSRRLSISSSDASRSSLHGMRVASTPPTQPQHSIAVLEV